MPSRRVVLDTNVLVSALLSPGGVPARAVAGAVDACEILIDARLVAEYRAVLARPHFRFAPATATALVDDLAAWGEVVPAGPPLGLELPDPTDLPFLEVATWGRAGALVTGNARHFVPLAGSHGVPVLSPRAFLDALLDASQGG